MAPGGRPPDCPLSEVPGVFSQAAALHLVASGDPRHQDRVLLHRPRLCQRGTAASAQSQCVCEGTELICECHTQIFSATVFFILKIAD